MKLFGKIILLVFTVIAVVFFVFRNNVLSSIGKSASEKIQKEYRLNLNYSRLSFSGLFSVSINGLKVTNEFSDTVWMADTLKITPSLFSIFLGHMRAREISLAGSDMRLDYALLDRFRKKDPTDTLLVKQANYAQLFYRSWERIFGLLPGEIHLRRSMFSYRRDSINTQLICSHFDYEGKHFKGDWQWNSLGRERRCGVQGTLSGNGKEMSVEAFRMDTSAVCFPYIGERFHATVGFDTLVFSLSVKELNKDLIRLNGTFSSSQLYIQHKRIGPDPVSTQSSGAKFMFYIGNRYAEMDSSTVVHVNQFSFSPYLRYEKMQHRILKMAFLRQEFEASALFKSLPKGLFSNFDGIETDGRLAYHMRAKVDFDSPDSVLFESQLENKGLNIVRYGATDFRKINGPFVHDVYEKDVFVKSILVGPASPDFVALDQISPYFRYSVLTSEDGDFFYHHGFNADAFRESIATNLKEGRFARGGSTISMQLVKNVFLSRNKTVSRKMEEALIVWMIENLRLVSKERMYEVYLNIMELGPGIYGIKPAAYFYFRKAPSALNLQESIFLSSIIPRPKAFRYSFLSNGVLRDYLANYYKLLGGIMVRRNQILSSDTLNLKPSVKLTGEARKFLTKPDTSGRAADSLYLMNEEVLPLLNN